MSTNSSLQLRVADTPWQRMRGLLGYPPLQADQGLLIRPCNMVHTVGMRYPIDIVYIDASGLILKVVASLPPLRASVCLQARDVLELKAGVAAAMGLQKGQQVPSGLWPAR